MAKNSSSPSISVINQQAVAVDNEAKNDVSREIYLVVKQLPFTIRVKAQDLDLREMDLSAKLYYDFDDSENPREVETLKITPLEYVCHVDENGKAMTLEVRVGVLTSAHEGAYFRVKILAQDTDTGRTYECFSRPLKIMSKRGQIRKMMERKAKLATQPLKTKGFRKRKFTEMDEPQSSPTSIPESPLQSEASPQINVADTLAKLQEQQQQQAALIQRLLQQQQSALPDFETSFMNFVQAYQHTAVEERKSKMRKVLNQLDSKGFETVNEVVNLCTAQDLFPLSLCGNNFAECPHKQHLDSLENFLSEFLHPNSIELDSSDFSTLQNQNHKDAGAVARKLKDIVATSKNSR